MEVEESFTYKEFFKNYGLFLALITIIFFILFYSVYFARKPWQKHLKTQVENVMDEYESNSWNIENNKKINNPFCLNAVCYDAHYRKTGELYSIILIRIQTFYGPIGAVFTMDQNNNVNFIGYSSLHGRIANRLNNETADKRLNYWKRKIPEILK